MTIAKLAAAGLLIGAVVIAFLLLGRYRDDASACGKPELDEPGPLEAAEPADAALAAELLEAKERSYTTTSTIVYTVCVAADGESQSGEVRITQRDGARFRTDQEDPYSGIATSEFDEFDGAQPRSALCSDNLGAHYEALYEGLVQAYVTDARQRGLAEGDIQREARDYINAFFGVGAGDFTIGAACVNSDTNLDPPSPLMTHARFCQSTRTRVIAHSMWPT